MTELNLDLSKIKIESELQSCDLCGSSPEFHKNLCRRDKYGFPISTVICRKCGNIFLNPRPTKSWYEWFYNNLYDKIVKRHFESSENLWQFFENEKEDGKRIYAAIQNFLPQSGKLLDVGCSLGGLAKHFEEKRWEVWGIDPMERHIKFAKENVHGTFLATSIENFDTGVKFNLIVILRTLNHLFSPFLFLEKTRDLLEESGFIYIEVIDPRFSLFKPHFRTQIDHPFLLSASTLRNYLTKAFFSLKTLRKINGYYQILATPLQEPSQKRKVKNFYCLNSLTILKNSLIFIISNSIRKWL